MFIKRLCRKADTTQPSEKNNIRIYLNKEIDINNLETFIIEIGY
jgi:hypothetical protein